MSSRNAPWSLSSQPVHFQNRRRAENVYVSLRRAKGQPVGHHTRSGSGQVPIPVSRSSVLEKSREVTLTRDLPLGMAVRGHNNLNANLLSEQLVPSSPPTCLPWFKKMKVMRSLRKRLGIVTRSDGNWGNNALPLLFHPVHGENIELSQEMALARRAQSFCKAIVFSHRPVKVNEKICIKFAEVSTNWSGVVRFGFTSHDPSSLKSSLPKYACPDLTSRVGFWGKAFHDYLVRKDSILFYYVTHTGDVHFGINGEEVGIFFKDVDTRGPLWAMMDIYGNTTAIEFVDPRAHLNNSRRSLEGDEVSSIGFALQSLNLSPESEISPIQFYPECQSYTLNFHHVHGKHVELGKHRFSASRTPNEYTNGYVFTARPLQLGTTILIQVLRTEAEYSGSLAFGLTSCNPEYLCPKSLPEDSYLLQDRQEYWVVQKEVGNHPVRGDELAFTLSPKGVVLVSKNGGPSRILMHVDTSVDLWAFFDLYGSTQRIALAGTIPPTTISTDRGRSLLVEPCGASTSNEGHALDSSESGWCPGTSLPFPSTQQSTSSHHPYSQNQHENPRLIRNHKLLVNKLPPSTPPALQERRSGELNWTVECVACCEKPVDSVFYQCGHLSMCYECAYEYWKNRQKTCCPICRSPITDVIRIYKS